MSSGFTLCPIMNQPNMNAYFIANMKENTSVEEFDEAIQKCENFNFNQDEPHSGNVVEKAQHCNNIKILTHVVNDLKQGHLLNVSSWNGCSPLLTAIMRHESQANTKASHKMIKTLVELGSDVNIVHSGMPVNGFPQHFSSLWCAIEKTNDLALIQFLFIKGAKVHPALSREGEDKLAAARQALFNPYRVLFEGEQIRDVISNIINVHMEIDPLL